VNCVIEILAEVKEMYLTPIACWDSVECNRLWIYGSVLFKEVWIFCYCQSVTLAWIIQLSTFILRPIPMLPAH